MIRKLSSLLGNRRGFAAAEYALVFALLGAVVTFGAMALGTSISEEIEQSDK